MKEHLAYFLLAFTSLFTIVNPLGAMPYFSGLTDGQNSFEVRAIAKRASLSAFVAMVLFALSGEFIFKFFNVSIDGLRVVGGVLFFINGYDMLTGKESRVKALSATEQSEAVDADSKVKAITPLAIPLICGPGTITVMTVMVQESEFMWKRGILFLCAGLICVATYYVLVGSRRIMALLGESGKKVFFRLMGLILMMIAVEFFFRGLTPYVQRLFVPVS